MRITARTAGNSYTNVELIQKLTWFEKQFGRRPTTKDCHSRNKMPALITYYNRFGSFDNAMERAGFQVDRTKHRGGKRKYTDEELLSYIRQFIETIGYIPTAMDYDGTRKEDFPAQSVFLYRFGTFEKALIKSGIKFSLVRYRIRAATKNIHSFANWLSSLLREKAKAVQNSP